MWSTSCGTLWWTITSIWRGMPETSAPWQSGKNWLPRHEHTHPRSAPYVILLYAVEVLNIWKQPPRRRTAGSRKEHFEDGYGHASGANSSHSAMAPRSRAYRTKSM